MRPFLKLARHQNLWLLALALVINTAAALSEGVSFGLILMALQGLSGESFSSTHKLFSLFGTEGMVPQQVFTLFMVLAVCAQILRGLFSYGGLIVSMMLGNQIQIEGQKQVYQQIFRLSFPCVNRYKLGDLLDYARIPATLISILIEPLHRAIVAALTLIASFAVMLFLSPVLTLLALLIFGFLGLSQKWIVQKISHISQTLTEHTVSFSKHAAQSLYGLRAIHTFHQQAQVWQGILETLDKIAKATNRLQRWLQSIHPISEIMGVFLVGLFLVLGQWVLADSGESALPILLTFVVILYRLNGRMQVFLYAVGQIAFHWGDILRLEEILDEGGKEFGAIGKTPFTGLRESIRFQGVSLSYETSSQPAVHRFNATLPKGSVTAFVGASGAGKSSLIDLLLKLYHPTSGQILIDGVNLTDLEVGSWRSRLGVVSQDPFIFNETVAENIRFGKPNASCAEVREAAKLAGADPFIQTLPQGYETILGERGYRLSGGERQKIALACALIRDPEILILDEATSHLDSQSEQFIQESLYQLQGKKTMVLIAHRLSTIQHADQIIVMEKGSAVERGTHSELLAQKGRYAAFWTLQSSSAR